MSGTQLRLADELEFVLLACLDAHKKDFAELTQLVETYHPDVRTTFEDTYRILIYLVHRVLTKTDARPYTDPKVKPAFTRLLLPLCQYFDQHECCGLYDRLLEGVLLNNLPYHMKHRENHLSLVTQLIRQWPLSANTGISLVFRVHKVFNDYVATDKTNLVVKALEGLGYLSAKLWEFHDLVPDQPESLEEVNQMLCQIEEIWILLSREGRSPGIRSQALKLISFSPEARIYRRQSTWAFDAVNEYYEGGHPTFVSYRWNEGNLTTGHQSVHLPVTDPSNGYVCLSEADTERKAAREVFSRGLRDVDARVRIFVWKHFRLLAKNTRTTFFWLEDDLVIGALIESFMQESLNGVLKHIERFCVDLFLAVFRRFLRRIMGNSSPEHSAAEDEEDEEHMQPQVLRTTEDKDNQARAVKRTILYFANAFLGMECPQNTFVLTRFFYAICAHFQLEHHKHRPYAYIFSDFSRIAHIERTNEKETGNQEVVFLFLHFTVVFSESFANPFKRIRLVEDLVLKICNQHGVSQPGASRETWTPITRFVKDIYRSKEASVAIHSDMIHLTNDPSEKLEFQPTNFLLEVDNSGLAAKYLEMVGQTLTSCTRKWHEQVLIFCQELLIRLSPTAPDADLVFNQTVDVIRRIFRSLNAEPEGLQSRTLSGFMNFIEDRVCRLRSLEEEVPEEIKHMVPLPTSASGQTYGLSLLDTDEPRDFLGLTTLDEVFNQLLAGLEAVKDQPPLLAVWEAFIEKVQAEREECELRLALVLHAIIKTEQIHREEPNDPFLVLMENYLAPLLLSDPASKTFFLGMRATILACIFRPDCSVRYLPFFTQKLQQALCEVNQALAAAQDVGHTLTRMYSPPISAGLPFYGVCVLADNLLKGLGDMYAFPEFSTRLQEFCQFLLEFVFGLRFAEPDVALQNPGFLPIAVPKFFTKTCMDVMLQLLAIRTFVPEQINCVLWCTVFLSAFRPSHNLGPSGSDDPEASLLSSNARVVANFDLQCRILVQKLVDREPVATTLELVALLFNSSLWHPRPECDPLLQANLQLIPFFQGILTLLSKKADFDEINYHVFVAKLLVNMFINTPFLGMDHQVFVAFKDTYLKLAKLRPACEVTTDESPAFPSLQPYCLTLSVQHNILLQTPKYLKFIRGLPHWRKSRLAIEFIGQNSETADVQDPVLLETLRDEGRPRRVERISILEDSISQETHLMNL